MSGHRRPNLATLAMQRLVLIIVAFVFAMPPAGAAHEPDYLPQLRHLDLGPLMPPTARGYSVGAPHLPPLPAELYGDPRWLQAGQKAFVRANYPEAITCFHKAGKNSALGQFDAGFSELYLGKPAGISEMHAALDLARKQNFAELADAMAEMLGKLSVLGLGVEEQAAR